MTISKAEAKDVLIDVLRENRRLIEDVERMDDFIRGRFILPSRRCTECGVVAGHARGCDVGDALIGGQP